MYIHAVCEITVTRLPMTIANYRLVTNFALPGAIFGDHLHSQPARVDGARTLIATRMADSAKM